MAKPKLRFPEFADEWKEKKAEELFENITIKGQENKPILAVTQDRGVLLREECGIDIKFDEKSLSNYKLVVPGNFIISLRSFQGGLELSNLEGIVSPAYTILNNIMPVDKDFYKLYFKSYAFIKKLNIAVEGIRDGKQISYTSFKTIKLPTTIITEQQKIADFLSKMDEKISNQEAVVSDYEELKKSLMQKIFSQEIRFKADDGSEYPEWEEKLIGDLMEVTSVKRVHESDWVSSGIPFYRAREIVALHNGECITPLYISHELFEENSRLSGKIKAGDLLVTGVGTIGIQYLVKASDEFYFKDGNIIWLKNENRIHGKYFYYCYDSTFVKNQIKSMAGIGTVGTYTIDSAKKTRIFVPCLKEQQKIADCLSAMDRKIEAEKKILEDWKELKKALLQQMFV